MDPLTSIFGDAAAGHQAFAERYQQAPASIPPAEAVARYQQVAPQLPRAVYQESAEAVFARLTPEQRLQLGQYLQAEAQAAGAGAAFPDANRDGIDDRLQDPRVLAQSTAQLHEERPGWLSQVLGRLSGVPGTGVPGIGAPAAMPGTIPESAPVSFPSIPGGALASAALGGIAALGLARLARGGGGGLLGGLAGGLPGGGLGGYMGGHRSGGPGWGRRERDDDD